MVEEFAAAFGLSLPTASGQVVSYDFFRERLDDLTDDQTMFLDFTEGLLVRFCRLWKPGKYLPTRCRARGSIRYKLATCKLQNMAAATRMKTCYH